MGRLQAMHLARRLPAGSYEQVALAGLQDTAPRAAVLSMHARMEGVRPDSWEDDAFVQVWGPRSAAWLIPRSAIAAFTLGRLPRDTAKRERLEQVAEHALRGGPDPQRRPGAATGRYLIRWDTRTTTLIPVDPPGVDPEDARRDLARRYLTWFGEPARNLFATWAGISRTDAAQTLAQIPEQPPLPTKPEPEGVRFLPTLDPYLFKREAPDPVSGLGTLLVDGEPAGVWRRRGLQLTVDPRPGVDRRLVEKEAGLLAVPLGGEVVLRFERLA